jgi:hypothetical protein
VLVSQYSTNDGAVRTHGYRLKADQVGFAYWARSNVFAYDLGKGLDVGGTGPVLDPANNHTLAQLALDLDKVRERASRTVGALGTPVFPQVWAGFREGDLPGMSRSDPLMARVAARKQVSVEELQFMDGSRLNDLLREEWKTLWLRPGESGNNTEFWLIAKKYISQPGEVLFEDFRDVLGDSIPNPVRKLKKPTATITNPTRHVADQLGIDIERAVKGPTDADAELGMQLEKAVIQELGATAYLCSSDDIVSMLLEPDKAVVPSGCGDPAKLPESVQVELMRAAAGRYATCCTDADLLEAVRHPEWQLYASGLARIQTFLSASEKYGPTDMIAGDAAASVYADFTATRNYDIPCQQNREQAILLQA